MDTVPVSYHVAVCTMDPGVTQICSIGGIASNDAAFASFIGRSSLDIVLRSLDIVRISSVIGQRSLDIGQISGDIVHRTLNIVRILSVIGRRTLENVAVPSETVAVPSDTAAV